MLGIQFAGRERMMFEVLREWQEEQEADRTKDGLLTASVIRAGVKPAIEERRARVHRSGGFSKAGDGLSDIVRAK